MNKAEFRQSLDEIHTRMKQLTFTKGEEYSRREESQFANFERGARDLGMLREQILMVYLSKHLDAITCWVRDLSNNILFGVSEPIVGRIDDALLYLMLLRGMAAESDAKLRKELGVSGQPLFEARVDGYAVKYYDGEGNELPAAAGTVEFNEALVGPVLDLTGSRAITLEPVAYSLPLRDHAAAEQLDMKFAQELSHHVGIPVADPSSKIRRFFMSHSGEVSGKVCAKLGYARGADNITSVDQLHGVSPDGVCVHVFAVEGSPWLEEARRRLQEEGFCWDFNSSAPVARIIEELEAERAHDAD
jgi:hypothetical protein